MIARIIHIHPVRTGQYIKGIVYSVSFRRCLLLLLSFLFLVTFPVQAEETIFISSDYLEYISQKDTYVAKGEVTIHFGDTALYADSLVFNNKSFDAVVTGNVKYEDPDAVMKADKVEINLKTKIGTIFDSTIFYRKQNIHLKGGDIRKIGEKKFFLDKAKLTTCDSDPPQWHITAKDITATQHKSITAWHSSFRVKDFPIFYTPYFWAPLLTERETGFLFPTFGYSSKRGHYYKEGFFWAIKDNQDATLYLDYYSEKGWAEGFDYRYIKNPQTGGEFWIYHIRDDNPVRNLYEVKSYVDMNKYADLSSYLKLNVVSNYDYYEEMESTSRHRFGLSTWKADPFGFASEERLQKYLESDFQVSQKFHSARTYFLAQGRQSLEGTSDDTPQSFPEVAFIAYTNEKKNISFNITARGTNFWREDGQRGQRLDINPNLYLSFGRLFTLTQRFGLRETSYFLNKPNLQKARFVADFGTSLSTKFYKKYTNFIHLIEPALEYTFIPPIDNDNIPFFDLIDSISHTSSLAYSLTNRISGLTSEFLEARFRLSQSYNLLDVDREFSPLLTEATLSSNRFDLSMNASVDVHDGNISETFASFRIKGKKGYVGAGKNFRRITLLDQYTFEFGLYHPIHIFKRDLPFDVQGTLWYDVKGGGVQELNLASTYRHQCWGLSIVVNKQPDEYQIIFAVELTGLGKVRLGSI